MRSLADRFFYFTEEGDYLPGGKPTTPEPAPSRVRTPVQARQPTGHYYDSQADLDALFEQSPAHSQAAAFPQSSAHAQVPNHQMADTYHQDATQTLDIEQYLSSFQHHALVQDYSALNQRSAVVAHPTSHAQALDAPPPTAAPVSGGGGGGSAGQTTVGLGLVVNGKTFPKIEGGQERWYTQRPGHGNSYSRYSDLVRHDKAKGLTPMPKASKAELAVARRQQTFG